MAFGYNIRLYTIEPLFSVFTSHVIKTKIVTIQCLKSRIWDSVIFRAVSPKFVELCMETPCLCPSEGHKHGGRKVTETSVTEFYY